MTSKEASCVEKGVSTLLDEASDFCHTRGPFYWSWLFCPQGIGAGPGLPGAIKACRGRPARPAGASQGLCGYPTASGVCWVATHNRSVG